MAVVGGGGQAELAIVHERTALRVPDGISWPEAGGFPEVFTTAHDALFTQCALGPGEHLLVHGAAGGVGVAGVQLGVLTGAQVTATVRNEALRAEVAALGDGIHVVAPDDFAAHAPYDVVLELVGAPNLAGNLDALAIGGRISVIGVGGGAVGELNLLTLMGKRARIHGSTLRPRPLEQKADAAQRVARHVLPAFADGRVRCRSPRPTRWPTRAPRTTTSPAAASSARSCSFRVTYSHDVDGHLRDTELRGRHPIDGERSLLGEPDEPALRAVGMVDDLAHDLGVVHVLEPQPEVARVGLLGEPDVQSVSDAART
jgi:hypothetical protein